MKIQISPSEKYEIEIKEEYSSEDFRILVFKFQNILKLLPQSILNNTLTSKHVINLENMKIKALEWVENKKWRNL